MKRLSALVLAMMIALSACSVLDFIKPSKGISVDTEIVAGDKEIATEVSKDKTTNTAESLTQTYNTVNEEYPMWVVVLLILGWMLPSPRQLGIGFINLFRRKK